MYKWLLKYFPPPYANLLVFVWYLFLLLLVLYSLDLDPGRFRYLQW